MEPVFFSKTFQVHVYRVKDRSVSPPRSVLTYVEDDTFLAQVAELIPELSLFVFPLLQAKRVAGKL